MPCPACETPMTGIRCACGYQAPTVRTDQRPLKFCEWIQRGLTCQVPTGRMSIKGSSFSHPPRLCSYHQERQRWSLHGTFVTEEQSFRQWAERFEPGTRYQPFPGIWDRDTTTLWKLVSGQMTWMSFQGSTTLVSREGMRDSQASAPDAGISMEDALADRPELLERLKRMGVGR